MAKINEAVCLENLIHDVALAQKLGIDKKTLRNRVSARQMPQPVRIAGSSRNYFLRSEIDAWLASVVERREPVEAGRRGRKSKAQQVSERGGMR